jgi:hypothetical protein
MDEARRLHEAFLEVRSVAFDPEDEPAAQDATLQATLKDKLGQYSDVVGALEAVLDAVPDEQRVEALVLLAVTHADMAGFMEGNPVPSYLTGRQSQAYERGIEDKAAVWWASAEARYDEARALTEEGSEARVAIDAARKRLSP